MSQQDNIFSRGVLLDIDFATWGTTKQINASITEEGVDSSYLRISKYLIAKDWMEPFNKIRTKINRLVKRYTIPFPIKGVKLIPYSAVSEFTSAIQEIQHEMRTATMVFAQTQFPQALAQAERDLGPVFQRADYPQDIARKFHLDYRFFTVSAPNHSSLVDAQIIAEEQRKFEAQIQEAGDQAVSYLVDRFTEVVHHLTMKLRDDQQFKQASVQNVLEFVEDFRHLKDLVQNGDADRLEGLVETVKSLLQGRDAREIKGNEFLKQRVTEELTQVDTVLQAMLEPGRRMVVR